ncbi:tRNA nucleotidyltransferase [Bordetella pertussis]|nr:tRNA nucleotidyltransferase [Bordetella pertussis]
MDQARLLPLAVDALLQAAAIVAPVDLSAWRARVQAVRAIDAGAIARQCAGDPARIKPALRQARLQALGGA